MVDRTGPSMPHAAERQHGDECDENGGAFETGAAPGHSGQPYAQAEVPFGWYYYGPEPPAFQPYGNTAASDAQGNSGTIPGATHGPAGDPGGPSAHQHHMGERDELAAYKEAFDRLSRGDVSADTIGKLLSLDEREFWKGALVGAAAVLLASNLPTLKAMFAGMAASATGSDKNDESQKSENVGATAEEEKK